MFFTRAERFWSRNHYTVTVLEFAAVMIFLSLSNRIFYKPSGHPKDLLANQRHSFYRVLVSKKKKKKKIINNAYSPPTLHCHAQNFYSVNTKTETSWK